MTCRSIGRPSQARFKDMVVDFQTLEAVGADIKVTGNGTLAFNDTGKSGFWLHAEAADLATVGKLTGQPLSGIAVLDTVVGGNQREFTATGTLTGDGLKYGTLDALSSSAEFKATIPISPGSEQRGLQRRTRRS